MGKAIHFAKMIDARLMADLFRYYAGMAPEIDGVTRSVSPAGAHSKTRYDCSGTVRGCRRNHSFNFH